MAVDWTITKPVEVGEIAEKNLDRVRIVSFQLDGDTIISHWHYGYDVGGEFIPSALTPLNRPRTLQVDKYADVRAAMANLERALLRRLSQDGEIPDGSG